MPSNNTPMISALRPGLAMNATWICLLSRKATRAPRTTNTIIRNRKMRGDDSLSGSSSFAINFGAMSLKILNAGRNDHAIWHRPVTRKKQLRRDHKIKRPIEFKLRCFLSFRGARASVRTRNPEPHSVPRLDSGSGAHAPSRNDELGSSLCRLFQHAQDFFLDGLVAGDDMAFGEHVVAPVAIGNEPAGLAHQDQPGRHVPGLDVALPIAVEPSGRNPGQIEGGGAKAAQARDMLLHGAGFPARQRDVAAADVRQTAGDHRVGEALAPGGADALLVQERALAAFGDKHLVVGRIVDQAGDDRALALKRDRDGELRNAVQKIGGAVERIDDPGVALVGALALAAFLADKAVTGPRLGKFGQQRLLGAAVGGGDEITRTFERDLQLLQFAEIAFERARGLARGGDHDVQESGVLHGFSLYPSLAGGGWRSVSWAGWGRLAYL